MSTSSGSEIEESEEEEFRKVIEKETTEMPAIKLS
jgi:hypothetical protein